MGVWPREKCWCARALCKTRLWLLPPGSVVSLSPLRLSFKVVGAPVYRLWGWRPGVFSFQWFWFFLHLFPFLAEEWAAAGCLVIFMCCLYMAFTEEAVTTFDLSFIASAHLKAILRVNVVLLITRLMFLLVILQSRKALMLIVSQNREKIISIYHVIYSDMCWISSLFLGQSQHSFLRHETLCLFFTFKEKNVENSIRLAVNWCCQDWRWWFFPLHVADHLGILQCWYTCDCDIYCLPYLRTRSWTLLLVSSFCA